MIFENLSHYTRSFPNMLLAHILVNFAVIFKYFHFQQNGALPERIYSNGMFFSL